ncbi:MAG: 3-deoxy-8-phosphooctulonate synthase [Holosporales bacterium]|jgi:2-dehydro-3-deoxyphosphooctonate aldolase (KDO 8-P synthase)|nr:3-deoxy-8-phosphooctulonate synthase [Holosporales bacterium]
MITVKVQEVEFSNRLPFVFIGGPCVVEEYEKTLFIGKTIKEACQKLKIPYVFKSSYDKANRTSISGKRGAGLNEGLEILTHIKKNLEVPVLTDVHLPGQCEKVAEIADILQIPAFLCRQTDLLGAAAKTGKTIHVKKGQFMAPWDMQNVVKKLKHFGAHDILLCDRGTSFGYNTLVSDFRGLPIMEQTGCPVVFDATHSIQQPSGEGDCSGGERVFAPILARAAVAVGVAGIFMEVHDDPDNAPCDGPNMVYLSDIEQILKELQLIDRIAKEYPRAL